jgi:ABC-type tungstate transport system permease subunit
VDGGVLDFLLPTFENETSEEVQAVICTGLAKMTLYGLVNDDRVSVFEVLVG